MNHLNNSMYDLIEVLLKEQFSEEVYTIAKDLLYQGPSTIVDIIKRLGVDFLAVRNTLIILLQNKLLKYEEIIRKDSKETVYEIDIPSVLNLLRFPKVLYYISQIFGENAVFIFEEFMQFGILSAGQCIEQIIFKLQAIKKINPTYVNNIKSVFLKLVEENFITQVMNLKTQELHNKDKKDKKDKNKNQKKKKENDKTKGKEASGHKKNEKVKTPKKAVAPVEPIISRKNQKKNAKKDDSRDLQEEQKIMDIEDIEEESDNESDGENLAQNKNLIKKSNSLLDDFVDDKNPLIFDQEKNKYYYFYINFDKIINEMKINLIVDMITQNINPQAGLVFQVILKRNFNYCVKNGKSLPYTAIDIFKEIMLKHPKSQIKQNKISELLDNLIDEHDLVIKWGFDDSNNPLYCLNFENISDRIRSRALEKMIEQQYSPMHLRVYRLLSKCGALDAKNIMELCLILQKECTFYLNQMLQDCFIETQTINSKGSNIIYYCVNKEANIEYLVVKIYKMIRNLKIFINTEIERIKNFESSLRQELYVNKIHGSISELDDIILILNIDQ